MTSSRVSIRVGVQNEEARQFLRTTEDSGASLNRS